MKLKFGIKDMKQIMEKYYREYKDFDWTFSTKFNLALVVYGMMEREDACVKMKMKDSLNISGMNIAMERDVSYCKRENYG